MASPALSATMVCGHLLDRILGDGELTAKTGDLFVLLGELELETADVECVTHQIFGSG